MDTLDNYKQFWNRKNSEKLYIAGLLTIILISLWFINKSDWEINGKVIWGIIIVATASYPALVWAKRTESWLPIFEIYTLIAIPQYALPLLAQAPELRFYSEAIVTKSALLIALHLIASIVGFSIFRRPLRINKLFSISLIPDRFYQVSHIGLFISNTYSIISEFYINISGDYQRILGACFLGINIISIFISSRLWGLNSLTQAKKIFFAINIIISVFISFTSLYLIIGFSSIFLCIISYSISKRKIPWTVTIFSVFLISLLHLGKAEMRKQYWDPSRGIGVRVVKLKINEIPAFFSEWINYGLMMERTSNQLNITENSSLDRASILPMLCLAVDRIPREKNYLMGSSYTSIPALLIPRFLWTSKPTALAANDQLMVHLGLVNPNNITVNIALGMPAEAYINFGFLGAIVLGLLLGGFYKNLSLLSKNSPQFSAVGILSILVIASLSQTGQNAALWLSTLFQMSVVCIGFPLAYKLIRS